MADKEAINLLRWMRRHHLSIRALKGCMRTTCTWDHVMAMRKTLTPYLSKGRVLEVATKGGTRTCVTTKPTPNTVHSPTPGQLHVESIQLACTCALCCCYALCMKREELSIFYSLWLRCFVVMLQYVGFLGRSQLFGSQVKVFSQVGAPSHKLARQKSGVGAPNPDLARQNCQVGARQVRLSRAPTAQSRAPNSWIGVGTLGARQLDGFGAPT